MPTEILMPELGESVHEGTVGRWLKKVGDTVKEDEPVVEIMTDKVNTELGAPASGVLTKILIQEGENVKVFEPLGLIGETGEVEDGKAETAPPAKPRAKEKAPPAPEPPAPRVEQPSPVSGNGGRRWYTPLVRSIAQRHGLSDADLSLIAGTGEGGRVTKRDVEAFLKTGPAAARPAAQPAAAPEFRKPEPVPGPEREVITLTGMRKAIADAMTKAHETPAVSTVTQVEVSRLVEFRKANKDAFPQMYGVRLTYTPFFIKAATEALVQHPTVNSALGGDGKLVINRAVHMGVAVALGDGSQGLIVPVIRDCHKKTLVEIARDLEAVAAKARDGKLELADLQGATFSLTNPGSYGALFGTPMIPPGQTAILGTYAIQDTPVAIEGMLGIRPVMHLVLSYDHRVVDGMLAGRFLSAVKNRLQEFAFFR